MKGALFLDRDGTIIVDRHYMGDPSLVQLIDGAGGAIRLANAHAIPVIVVTNQSGIGRGRITPEQYHAVHRRMIELLSEHGATIDASYHCPHWPENDGECACRKPALGMYRRAAMDHDIDLSGSAFVGDRWRDVEPGVVSGGLAILVQGADTPASDTERATNEAKVMKRLEEAVKLAVEFIDLPSQIAHEGTSVGE